jgi:hypothetical protein
MLFRPREPLVFREAYRHEIHIGWFRTELEIQNAYRKTRRSRDGRPTHGELGVNFS